MSEDQAPFPRIGTHYLHANGKIYRVAMIARLESDCTVMVVYQSNEDAMAWVRPLGEFVAKFTYIPTPGDWELPP